MGPKMSQNPLSMIFTWWNGLTVGTWWFTRRHGKEVGRDDQGNIYYQNHDWDRRWVIYNGLSEASRVPADWHAWLHGLIDEPPTDSPLPKQDWEQEHLPNLTGTPDAYHPQGSLYGDQQPKSRPTYEAWRPE